MVDSEFDRSLGECFASADINDPVGLARIVGLVGRTGSFAPSIVLNLQSFLFEHTVRYCLERVPFYARLPTAQMLLSSRIELSVLRELPLLDRHTVQEHAEALTAEHSQV